MSETTRLLRGVMRAEQRRQPGISTARVEAVNDDGSHALTLDGDAANVRGTSLSDLEGAPGDAVYVLHLGGGRAPMEWQPAMCDIGGASPPVVSI